MSNKEQIIKKVAVVRPIKVIKARDLLVIKKIDAKTCPLVVNYNKENNTPEALRAQINKGKASSAREAIEMLFIARS